MRFLTILISQDISAVRRAALLQQRNRRRRLMQRRVTALRKVEKLRQIPVPRRRPAKDERFIYQPTAVVIDEGNRMYVVAKGCYQGLIELSSDGTFTKFVGATKTTANISAIWRRLISEKQRESLEQSLSTEYTNAFMDADGMIFRARSETLRPPRSKAILRTDRKSALQLRGSRLPDRTF